MTYPDDFNGAILAAFIGTTALGCYLWLMVRWMHKEVDQ